MIKRQLLTLLFMWTLGSLFSQTNVNFDNTSDLVTYFNPSSTPIFTNIANSGINNSGSINVPLGTDDIWTTKVGYSMIVGGIYTMTGDFLIKENAGYGGLGFAVSNTNDPDSYGSPVLGLGMCFHGGGGMFVNNGSVIDVSWPPDLVLGNWYRMSLKITCVSANTFNLFFEIYNLSSTGVVGALKTTQVLNGVVNNDVFATPSIHVYFSAAGSRMEKIDNFTITLSGGALEVHSPDVTTADVTSVTTSSAISGGNVTNDYGYPVTARGVCYSSTNNQPVITGLKTSDGSGTGTFTSNLTGLSTNTTYYVRSYATNAIGTNYGETKSFVTTSTPPTPTSITVSSSSICSGSSVTLTANGTAGTVYWYSGTCGGTTVGTGNPISLSPSSTTTYYANCYNGTQYSAGCASTTITVSPAPTGGTLTGTNSITYGSSTGSLVLSGYSGTISSWQKRLDLGAWVNISNTNNTYSETPTSIGNWDYRAVITSGVCATVYSSVKSISVQPKQLTVTGAQVVSKIYDGNTLATITGATLTGVVTGENVILNNATQGNFNNPLVGANKPVTTNMTITGTSVANYTLQQPTLLGEILSNALNVIGIVAASKVYDGNNIATLSGGTLIGVIPGDIVSVVVPSTGTFATTNVGTNIAVTVPTPTLTGPDALKYTVNQPTGITANITSKELFILAVEKEKTYGQSDPQLTHTFTGFIPGEDESDLLTPVVTTRVTGENVGQYVIYVSGATSNNYLITFINNQFIIVPKDLMVSTNDASRCSGTENPLFPLTYSGFVNNENTSVLTTLPTASCTATTTSDPGTYPIIISGGVAQNYSFVYNEATLTVKELPVRPTITQDGHILHSSATTGNQWYNLNGVIPSATQQDYYVTVEGTYYVIVKQNGCSSEPSESISVLFTGISQIDEVSTKIYPNPATDLVNIETSVSGQTKAELLSQAGKTMLVTEFYGKTTMDLNHIPSGLYLIKITNNNGVKTYKIVVQ